ncbi:type III pantothenate kinase [Marinobacter alexandrii]|uniref:type III pantothenate kinase n=1 Tax=Marinobacter alexandrii TaxID=2570351 RepID=UPI003296AD9D
MSEYCLQLDVGNSSAKWRLMKMPASGAKSVAERGSFHIDGQQGLAEIQSAAKQASRVWLSSVADAHKNAQLLSQLSLPESVHPWFARSAERFGDLVNSYQEPSRMGVDRWLAMVAARSITTQRCCVIDAGSALTIDWVSQTGQHDGGYIIPGPALMERALLLDTDNVRFEEAPDYRLNPGVSTAEAVRHGIALAQAGAVELALRIAHFHADRDRVFFTGGAGRLLAELTGHESSYSQDLVFEGLELVALSR